LVKIDHDYKGSLIKDKVLGGQAGFIGMHFQDHVLGLFHVLVGQGRATFQMKETQDLLETVHL
jgi:hypothetical protein